MDTIGFHVAFPLEGELPRQRLPDVTLYSSVTDMWQTLRMGFWPDKNFLPLMSPDSYNVAIFLISTLVWVVSQSCLDSWDTSLGWRRLYWDLNSGPCTGR
jgi:hypothetical protein